MSTLISAAPYAGTITSSKPQKMSTPKKDARALFAETRTKATAHLARRLESVRASVTEKFYQDHITAIFFGLYVEVALAPLLATLSIYMYGHWMM